MRKAVIIGSGLGGSTLSRCLLEAGFSVTILEKGGAKPQQNSRSEVFSERNFGLRFYRNIGVGGTTTLWHGGLMPMSSREVMLDDDFGEVFKSLQPAYQEILETAIGETNIVNLDGNIIETINNNLSLVEIAVPSRPETVLPPPEARLVTDVSDIEFLASGRKVVGVVAVCGKQRVVLDVDVLIIAAGGLNTPALVQELLESTGINNSNVGCGLIDHPMGFIGKVRFKRGVHRKGVKQKPAGNGYFRRRGFGFFDDATGLNHCFYLRPTFSSRDAQDLYKVKQLAATYRAEGRIWDLAKILADPDILMEAFALKLGLHLPTRNYSILAVTQQKRILDRSVIRDGGLNQVKWYFTEEEIGSIRRGISCLLSHLADDIAYYELADDIGERLWSAAHFSGTCAIARSSANGVVDQNLLIHGLNNAFICDGSVMPITGYSNTGISIIALARRLSGHLQMCVR